MALHKLFPEPGAWVLDNYHDLPITEPPDHPITEPLTTKQVAEEVEYHGLGVCIYSYIFPKHIKDKELRRRWIIARKALMDVTMYLEDGDRHPRKKVTQLKKGKRLA